VYGLGMTLAFAFYERDLTMEVIRNTDRMIGELRTSEAIRMVIRTAITWNREHRFRSAGEFHSALQAAVTRRDIGPSSRPPRAELARSAAAATAIAEVSLDTPTSGPVAAAAPSAAMLARTAFAASPQDPAPVSAPPEPVSEAPLSLARRFAAHANDAERLVDKAVSEVFASLEVHDDSDPPPKAARVPPSDDQTQLDAPRRLMTRTVPIAVGVGLLLILVFMFAT